MRAYEKGAMKVNYLSKEVVTCQMCGEHGKEQYIATPEIPRLVDWESILLCKKCARREFGSKKAKAWKAMHELGTNV
tara:strand:+ start:362 stop:592 length:231 start_codon:yes stop_codon:yes gene_type:complete